MSLRWVLASVVVGLAAGAFLFVHVLRDRAAPGTTADRAASAGQRGKPSSASRAPGTSADYSAIWTTCAPPAKSKPAQSPRKPSVTFHLKGILSQGLERVAVIQEESGRQRLVRQGETVAGAKITQIAAHQITVEIGGEAITLSLDAKPDAPPSTPPKRPRGGKNPPR